MQNKTIEHIKSLFQYHLELAEKLPDEAFTKKLPVSSNTIGQQFWCIIGARESYAKALQKGGWDGFVCSMEEEKTKDKTLVIEYLKKSANEMIESIKGLEWIDERNGLLLDLLEHEALHQGQLIRYVYGLKYTFPKSWIERWALDE